MAKDPDAPITLEDINQRLLDLKPAKELDTGQLLQRATSGNSEPDTVSELSARARPLPSIVRSGLSFKGNREDKLNMLRELYDEVIPVGDNNSISRRGEEIYIEDPEGLDLGDIAGMTGPAIAMALGTVGAVAGGTGGGAIGSVIPGAGTVAGAGAGAALGGGLGEAFRQWVGTVLPGEETITVPERLIKTADSALSEAVGVGVGGKVASLFGRKGRALAAEVDSAALARLARAKKYGTHLTPDLATMGKEAQKMGRKFTGDPDFAALDIENARILGEHIKRIPRFISRSEVVQRGEKFVGARAVLEDWLAVTVPKTENILSKHNVAADPAAFSNLILSGGKTSKRIATLLGEGSPRHQAVVELAEAARDIVRVRPNLAPAEKAQAVLHHYLAPGLRASIGASAARHLINKIGVLSGAANKNIWLDKEAAVTLLQLKYASPSMTAKTARQLTDRLMAAMARGMAESSRDDVKDERAMQQQSTGRRF